MESRRFRIKLAPNGGVSSLEVCRQCRMILSTFITFKEISTTLDSSFTDCSQSILSESSQSQQTTTCPSPPKAPMETDSSQLVVIDNTREPASQEQSSLLVDTNSLAKVSAYIVHDVLRNV